MGRHCSRSRTSPADRRSTVQSGRFSGGNIRQGWKGNRKHRKENQRHERTAQRRKQRNVRSSQECARIRNRIRSRSRRRVDISKSSQGTRCSGTRSAARNRPDGRRHYRTDGSSSAARTEAAGRHARPPGIWRRNLNGRSRYEFDGNGSNTGGSRRTDGIRKPGTHGRRHHRTTGSSWSNGTTARRSICRTSRIWRSSSDGSSRNEPHGDGGNTGSGSRTDGNRSTRNHGGRNDRNDGSSRSARTCTHSSISRTDCIRSFYRSGGNRMPDHGPGGDTDRKRRTSSTDRTRTLSGGTDRIRSSSRSNGTNTPGRSCSDRGTRSSAHISGNSSHAGSCSAGHYIGIASAFINIRSNRSIGNSDTQRSTNSIRSKRGSMRSWSVSSSRRTSRNGSRSLGGRSGRVNGWSRSRGTCCSNRNDRSRSNSQHGFIHAFSSNGPLVRNCSTISDSTNPGTHSGNAAIRGSRTCNGSRSNSRRRSPSGTGSRSTSRISRHGATCGSPGACSSIRGNHRSQCKDSRIGA